MWNLIKRLFGGGKQQPHGTWESRGEPLPEVEQVRIAAEAKRRDQSVHVKFSTDTSVPAEEKPFNCGFGQPRWPLPSERRTDNSDLNKKLDEANAAAKAAIARRDKEDREMAVETARLKKARDEQADRRRRDDEEDEERRQRNAVIQADTDQLLMASIIREETYSQPHSSPTPSTYSPSPSTPEPSYTPSHTPAHHDPSPAHHDWAQPTYDPGPSYSPDTDSSSPSSDW